jgi:hypothetical protein
VPGSLREGDKRCHVIARFWESGCRQVPKGEVGDLRVLDRSGIYGMPWHTLLRSRWYALLERSTPGGIVVLVSPCPVCCMALGIIIGDHRPHRRGAWAVIVGVWRVRGCIMAAVVCACVTVGGSCERVRGLLERERERAP